MEYAAIAKYTGCAEVEEEKQRSDLEPCVPLAQHLKPLGVFDEATLTFTRVSLSASVKEKSCYSFLACQVVRAK